MPNSVETQRPNKPFVEEFEVAVTYVGDKTTVKTLNTAAKNAVRSLFEESLGDPVVESFFWKRMHQPSAEVDEGNEHPLTREISPNPEANSLSESEVSSPKTPEVKLRRTVDCTHYKKGFCFNEEFRPGRVCLFEDSPLLCPFNPKKQEARP